MTAEQERDEALVALKDVLENYKYNNRKGIGMGPLVRAKRILDKYNLLNCNGEENETD